MSASKPGYVVSDEGRPSETDVLRPGTRLNLIRSTDGAVVGGVVTGSFVDESAREVVVKVAVDGREIEIVVANVLASGTILPGPDPEWN